MKNFLTKDILKEIMIILILTLSQIVLFLSGYNVLVLIVIIPIYLVSVVKNVYRRFLISFILSSAVLMVISKPIVAILFLSITYVIPFILWISIYVIKDWRHDFLLLSSGFLLFEVLSIKAIKVIYNIDIIRESNLSLKTFFDNYFKAIGQSVDVEKMVKIISLMMPSFFIIEAMTLSLIAIYVSKWLAKKLKIQKHYTEFSNLFMPKEVTIGAIAFLIIQLFLKEFNMTYVIVSNIIIIISYLLFIQCLTLIYSILKDKIAVMLVKNIIMIFFIALCIQLFFVSILIGFLDLMFDFKKRKPKKV